MSDTIPKHHAPFDPNFLLGLEWFDNSRISTINGCKRKGLWQLIGPPGGPGPLSNSVGQAADFGTCMHAAKAMFESAWGKLDFQTRAVLAARMFAATWERLFNAVGPLKPEHTLDRGIEILSHYLDSYEDDDRVLKPIDPELGFAVLIKPEAKFYDPDFKPFWYVGRCDGVYERLSNPFRDWTVGETKTTSGGVERRIKALKIDRQPVGYVHCLRDVMGYDRISCFMPDVIGVMRKSFDVARDFFMVSRERSLDWRHETIQIVEEWRERKFKAGLGTLRTSSIPDAPELHCTHPVNPLHVFYKETEECFKYGQCPYYDLCDFGVSATTLSDFLLNSWNPLAPPGRDPIRVISNDATAERLLNKQEE